MSVEIAEALARRLHQSQVDLAGLPYIEHLERVVGYVRSMFPDYTDIEIETAWLHDAKEDTGASVDSMVAAGVSLEAAQLVDEWLSRRTSMSYLNWIKWVADNAPLSALRVKLADNRDNSDPTRLAAIPNDSQSLLQRYEKARHILEAALERRYMTTPGPTL